MLTWRAVVVVFAALAVLAHSPAHQAGTQRPGGAVARQTNATSDRAHFENVVNFLLLRKLIPFARPECVDLSPRTLASTRIEPTRATQTFILIHTHTRVSSLGLDPCGGIGPNTGSRASGSCFCPMRLNKPNVSLSQCIIVTMPSSRMRRHFLICQAHWQLV